MNHKEFIQDMARTMREYVARSLLPVSEKIDSLGEKIKELSQSLEGIQKQAGPQGEKGDKGEPGEKGEKGDTGERGEPGQAGERGEQGEKGLDGKDGAQGERGEQGPQGLPGERGMQGEKGLDGADGKPGENGRDAVQIDILDGVDAYKRYQRGTYAYWQGGIVRSFRTTDPLADKAELDQAGWHVVVRGIAETKVEIGDDLRSVSLGLIYTDGLVQYKSINIPTMIYRGVFKEGTEYAKGDAVTWGGSLWHCNEATAEKPIDGGKSWQLAAKKGRDGKDAV